jgi:hypothetical protein
MRVPTTPLSAGLTTALAAGLTPLFAAGAPPAASPTASASPTVSLATAAAPTGPSPTRFDHPRANPWFPLRPGDVWVLRGTDEGRRYSERVTVLHRHRVVAGVRATVVRDVLRRAGGSVAELTHDWYAADHRGTVWYLGERTATYDRHGAVTSREGTWEAGRGGAVAGRIMPAHPRVTDAFRQEYRRGRAEDQAWVVQRGARVRTPALTTRSGLRTLEWTRLEPGVVSQKLYARGRGLVAERDLAGGTERFVLVRFARSGR